MKLEQSPTRRLYLKMYWRRKIIGPKSRLGLAPTDWSGLINWSQVSERDVSITSGPRLLQDLEEGI